MAVQNPKHIVAIVGGAISGSVAAEILAAGGCEVVVIEQNDRPYGKIEDGLPRWHTKQRRMEYGNIDARLTKPGIHFVPRTRLGRDFDFLDVATKWGFSAVMLANGAWRDRTLELPGADDFVNRGLVYQNPFIYWFNHKNEKTYSGQRYTVPDGTICVGGGLASIDVIKVIQLELWERALRARGIETDMYHLEHAGIPKVCKEHGIEPKDLGVQGGLLVYRRRVEDMPLADPPSGASPEQAKKIELVRRKILEKCKEKYLFRFEAQRLSVDKIVEGDRLVGIRMAETKVEGRKAEPIPGSERDVRADLTISSIGSVPERIPGVNMKGEYYTYKNWDTGEYEGLEGVFGLGNVVTGKGNINDSLKHGQLVGQHVLENYLGISETGERDISAALGGVAETGVAKAAEVARYVQSRPKLPHEKVEEILERVRKRQREVGYESDYKAWIAKVTPPDLE